MKLYPDYFAAVESLWRFVDGGGRRKQIAGLILIGWLFTGSGVAHAQQGILG